MIDNANEPPETRECPNPPAMSESAKQREVFYSKRRILLFISVGLILINTLLEMSGINVLSDFADWPFLVALFWLTFELLIVNSQARMKYKPHIGVTGFCLDLIMIGLGLLLWEAPGFDSWFSLLATFTLSAGYAYLGVLLTLRSLGRFNGFRSAFPPPEAWVSLPRRRSGILAVVFLSLACVILLFGVILCIR